MDDIKNKKSKKKVCKKKTKDKKGFTLIELLAVIIILGILLLIAVPSISKYIENSRKNTYINSIKSMVNAVSTSVNALELPFGIGKNEGIIVPFSEVNLEKGSAKKKSPYANWEEEKSYILVVFDGEMYKYYISALDEAGYGLPLVYDKSLNTGSITIDASVMSSNTVSYQDIINSPDSAFDTDAATMKYLNHSGNIVKVKVGYSTYDAGDIIQLKDGSKWYTALDSTIDDERIDLVSYYSMSTSSYGIQDATNPTIRFHYSQQNPAVYDANASMYPISEGIVSGTQVELVKNGIDLNGASVSMPRVTDFGCTTEDSNCRITCFKNDGNIPFWTIDTDGEWVFTITSSGVGRANTESNGFGIRVVVKNILKSNIDKQATKALN